MKNQKWPSAFRHQFEPSIVSAPARQVSSGTITSINFADGGALKAKGFSRKIKKRPLLAALFELLPVKRFRQT